MSKNKNRANDSGLDLFTPIYEIFHELLVLIADLVGELCKFAFTHIQKKYFGNYRIIPIKTKDLTKKKVAEGPTTLGYSINHKVDFLATNLNTQKHTAIIGSTGSGKTVCTYLLIEAALKKGMPVIYFDPKASLENIKTFKSICRANDKKLYVFSDIDEIYNTPFNPLQGGSLDDISDKIINALDWSEPFYKNESIEALDEVLRVLHFSKTPITLESILVELKKHKNFKNIKGLYNQLSKVSLSDYGPLLNHVGTNTLNFTKLRFENACLYIGISAMGHSSTGSILNKIFFGGLLTHAKESLSNTRGWIKKPKEMPISIFFDELSSTIHEGFIDLQNKCREAAMEITYATQGPSDIDRIDPKLTRQIFENTNNLFIFNQVVPEHTEFFSRMFGTYTSEKKTQVIEDKRKLDSGSVRETEEFLVHSNVFRNLKVGQCVLLQRIPKRIDLLNVRFWKAPKEVKEDYDHSSAF